MRERAVTFGSHAGLVGVTCEPDGGPLTGSPATLLFNIGLNHRVGPGRLNVDLARRLASAGYASLRFDVSGLGDSEARQDARSDLERQVVDLREAMDFLGARSGSTSFILMGLCSGTDGVHGAALADGRVSGAMAGWSVCPPGIEAEYWPDADHSFSTVAVRWRAVEDLAAWIEARFPGGRAQAADTGAAP